MDPRKIKMMIFELFHQGYLYNPIRSEKKMENMTTEEMIAELERENNMLRARNKRQENEIEEFEKIIKTLRAELLKLRNEKHAR